MSNKSKSGNTATPELKSAVEKAEKATSKQTRQDTSNEVVAVKRITEKKDLMYIYPEDCTTLGDRKRFRTSCRGKVRTMLKAIEKLKEAEATPDEIRKASKEYNRFLKGIHTAPELITLEAVAE